MATINFGGIDEQVVLVGARFHLAPIIPAGFTCLFITGKTCWDRGIQI